MTDLPTRRPVALLRPLPGHRHRHRRPRPARPDRGEASRGSARRRRRARLGDAAARPTPTTTRASRCCPRSTPRWWSPSRPATCAARTSSAPAGTAGRCCRQRRRGQQQAADQDARRQPARVRRHRGRRQGHAVQMQSGHKVVLDDGAQQVEVTHPNGCVDHVQRRRPGRRSRANATVDVTASAVNVHAADRDLRRHHQLHHADRVVGVVSPSYTPGAGNVW